MPLLNSNYNHVAEDDRKIPMAMPAAKRGFHRDEDFEDGIGFTAKYIGSQDVAQPHNRVEIVAAMRRIRFECKTRGVKKQKVDVTISVRGVRVAPFKRNKKKFRAEESPPILDHPIHRIFYVSHDSHDLLIFSYISRESASNLFCCNVFKAFKKSHALQVVRTIGQAFDVCHRLALEAELSENDESRNNDSKATTDGDPQPNSTACKEDVASGPAIGSTSLDRIHTTHVDSGHPTASSDVIRHAQQILANANYKPSATSIGGATLTPQTIGTITSPLAPHPLTDGVAMGDGTLVSSRHQMQLFLQQQVALQSQQTHCLLSQMQLLKDQLAAETEARIEAQVRIHQLLLQNQELLEHVGVLVERLLQLEEPAADKAELIQLPQVPVRMSELTSSVCLSHLSLQRSHHVTSSSRLSAQNVSPDSGHREMSSDSLSVGEAIAAATQAAMTMTTRSNPPTLAPLGSQQSMTSQLLRRPSAAHSVGTTAAHMDLLTGHHGDVRNCCSLGRDASCAGHLLVAPRSALDASIVSMSRVSRHVTSNQTSVGPLRNSVHWQNWGVEGASSEQKTVTEGGSGNVGVVVSSNGLNRTSALSLHSQNSVGELRPPSHMMTVDSLPMVTLSNS